MTFLNSGLLFGLFVAAIPVILHFLMKQKPKKLLFPALRLLQQVQRQSVRRLRLRHVLLMLLRALALVLIVLALARPSVPPANYGLSRWELLTLLGLATAGMTVFFVGKSRLKQSVSNTHVLQQRAIMLRNRTTLATLAAILLLVGWPYQRRISAELVTPRSATELNLPVAGVMLFDNSLSMSYLEASEDALQRAKVIAKGHLQTLPAGSRIAIGESGNDRTIPFQATMQSAFSRIDALTTSPVAIPLEDRLRESLKTHDDDRRRTLADQEDRPEQDRKDRYVRRVYLFTDLARSAWKPAGNSLLKAELEKNKNVNLYVIDAGRTSSHNQAITDLTLSGERIPIGGELAVAASLLSQGPDVPRTEVELLLAGKGGEQLKQGQVSAKLDTNLPTQVQFPLLGGLNQRWVHGEVQLTQPDPLSFDNVRYFSVEVTEPPEVLVAAPSEAMAQTWITALAPHDGRGEALNKFKPRFERFDRLKELTLSQYPNITLINCPRLPDDVWYQLGKYVEEGGGLIIVLGSTEIDSTSYNRASAQTFLPARLDSWHPLGEWSFVVNSRAHPLFSIFRRLDNYGSFSMFENLIYVTRFWKVTPAEGAHVVANYSDEEHWPAILERNHGKGRTVMLTTDATLPDNPNNRWNNLPSPLVEPWLFLAFVEQLTSHVSRFGNDQHQFLCGQTPVVHLPAQPTDRAFLLKTPDLKQFRNVLRANETLLAFKDVIAPGHYGLTEESTREVVGGFSLNVPAEESDLTRMTNSDLEDRLGKDRFQIAENLQQLKDQINTADLGQEIFPLLLVLVVVLFCGEHLVANRFYENTLEA